MMYPVSTVRVLEYLGYVNDVDFEVNNIDGVIILDWRHVDPKPTEQALTDTSTDPAFLVWYAEHGGDPALTRRRIAKELIDKVDAQEQALRAVVLAVNARTNQIANRLNQVLDAIDSSNNHGQLLTNIGAIADLPTIPKTELRTTIFSYVTSGESDGPIQD